MSDEEVETGLSKDEDGKFVIRPSSIGSFVNCNWQWYNTFVKGMVTIPSARASIGTAIHKGAEVLWNDAIKTGKVDDNLNKLNDAAIECYKEEHKKGLSYDEDEDEATAQLEVLKGVACFVGDIVPFTDIPDAVETRLTVKLDHHLVSSVSGTLDYLKKSTGTIADVKTSKRKPTVANHIIQQSTYKLLAEENGIKINNNLIHNVTLTKSPVGVIEEVPVQVPQAKFLINHLLDKLDILETGKVDPMALFSGNPKYYLCSNKYCALHKTCPFAQGDR